MTLSLQPKTTVSLVGANVAAENTAQRLLFVGQKVAAGSATAGALVENIGAGAEDALFGARSMIAGMIRAARRYNEVTRFDAIALDDDGGGVDAAGIVLFGGSATETGELTITIGSEANYKFTIAVESGDTAPEVGDALVTAVTANTDIGVIASNSLGTVTITAVNAGTLGNAIGLSVNGAVAGVTVSLTAMTSGAGDPTLTGVFDVIGESRYQGIVWPYFANTAEVRNFLDARLNVDRLVLDGRAITASVDSLADHLSRLNALNSSSLVDICDKETDETTFKGPSCLELLPEKAAQVAAIRALRLTDGANIGQFVLSANGLLDAFGGPALASKPYFNTPLPRMPLTGTGRGWNETEIQQLFESGGSIIGNNIANNGVVAGELVTTYKTDAAGNADISFKFLNYIDTSSGAREYFHNNLISRFAQSRLTKGDVLPGRDIANDLVIRSFCEKLYQDLAGPDFVLLEFGEEALTFFKSNLNIDINKELGRVTITMIVPLVTQLREMLATMKIAFSTQG